MVDLGSYLAARADAPVAAAILGLAGAASAIAADHGLSEEAKEDVMKALREVAGPPHAHEEAPRWSL
ncbi:MAG: hypothetical protein VXW25_04870, partial [Pseudomonadota bacterium]|nr:hypothetical protein [Pseudomonadota bacterium]